MCNQFVTEPSDMIIYVKIAVIGSIFCTLHQVLYWATSNNFPSRVQESEGGKKYPPQNKKKEG
jgi:hypothetical protein